jgi:tetratricopeptide (TPR) repeat protein
VALNPVEQRLLSLGSDWIEFRSDSTKRLLLWQVQENAFRLVQCFFEAQKHDLEYATGDQFIVFDTAFEHSFQYSRALKESLRGQYDASRADLEQQGLEADWDLETTAVPDTVTGVMQFLRAFGSRYHQTIGHLVVVLNPEDVSEETFFVDWLRRALDTHLPERLRLVILDSIEHPRWTGLSEAKDARVVARAPPIDGLATAQETFAQERAVGPAAVFRNYLMGVVALVDKGSADQVKAKAKDALTFARAQGWRDQEVVLRMLVAGALLKEGRHAEAIRVYQAARQTANYTLDSEHPAGRQLVLQAWLGEAGAHLAAADPVVAAGCYDQAALMAQEDNSPVLRIEACRMGAFCLARAGRSDDAIQRGLQAIEAGAGLKADERLMSSLPIAMVDLLRTLDPDRVRRLEECKWRLEQSRYAARAQLESRASELERQPDPTLMQSLESNLARELERTAIAGERELEAIVAQSSTAFRAAFDRGRELLGPDWPLHCAIGLFPTEPAHAEGGSSR